MKGEIWRDRVESGRLLTIEIIFHFLIEKYTDSMIDWRLYIEIGYLSYNFESTYRII